MPLHQAFEGRRILFEEQRRFHQFEFGQQRLIVLVADQVDAGVEQARAGCPR
jgi:hypothetical protein